MIYNVFTLLLSFANSMYMYSYCTAFPDTCKHTNYCSCTQICVQLLSLAKRSHIRLHNMLISMLQHTIIFNLHYSSVYSIPCSFLSYKHRSNVIFANECNSCSSYWLSNLQTRDYYWSSNMPNCVSSHISDPGRKRKPLGMTCTELN